MYTHIHAFFVGCSAVADSCYIDNDERRFSLEKLAPIARAPSHHHRCPAYRFNIYYLFILMTANVRRLHIYVYVFSRYTHRYIVYPGVTSSVRDRG